MDVFKTVKELIVEELSVDEGQVTMEAKFIDDLGADSLNMVELMMAIEKAFESFNIEISDEEAAEMTTVGDVVKYIKEKIE